MFCLLPAQPTYSLGVLSLKLHINLIKQSPQKLIVSQLLKICPAIKEPES